MEGMQVKKTIVVSLVALSLGRVFAQTDSAKVAAANWKQEQIYAGVWYGFNQFGSLFASAQSISVLDVDLNSARVKIAFPYVNGRKLTGELAQGAGAIAAVNGTFFDLNGSGSIEYFKVGGSLIKTTNDTMDFRDEASLSVLSSGASEITRIPAGNSWSSYNTNGQYQHMMAAGPLLLYAGSAIAYANVSFNVMRHPRTLACLTYDNHLKLAAIDGRTTMASGMSVPELQVFTKGLGCKDALNYDGGGSTTMWISGKPFSGVVNYPSDNGLYDHLGERTVANIIAILPDNSSGIKMNFKRKQDRSTPNFFYNLQGKTLRLTTEGRWNMNFTTPVFLIPKTPR